MDTGLGAAQCEARIQRQFHWWRTPEYPGETIDLRQVTDKLSYIGPAPVPGPNSGRSGGSDSKTITCVTYVHSLHGKLGEGGGQEVDLSDSLHKPDR